MDPTALDLVPDPLFWSIFLLTWLGASLAFGMLLGAIFHRFNGDDA